MKKTKTPINGITWMLLDAETKAQAVHLMQGLSPVSDYKGCLTLEDPEVDPVRRAWENAQPKAEMPPQLQNIESMPVMHQPIPSFSEMTSQAGHQIA